MRVVIEANEAYPVLSITDERDDRFESLIDPARYSPGYNPCRELPQAVVDEINRFADLDQEMHEFLSAVQDGTEAKPPRLVAVPRELLTATQVVAGDLPYIITQVVTEVRLYNPAFGDERLCKCGHIYGRHFDGYEDPECQDVGCKYCACYTFVEEPRRQE